MERKHGAERRHQYSSTSNSNSPRECRDFTSDDLAKRQHALLGSVRELEANVEVLEFRRNQLITEVYTMTQLMVNKSEKHIEVQTKKQGSREG